MKKYNFDVTTTADTYDGGLELPYVSAAILGAETIAKGRCRLIEGVTKSAIVSGLTVADPISAAACAASTGTALTLTEQVATLNDLMVNQTICRKTIFPTWIAAQGQMQRNGDIPPEWTDFLLTTVAAKTGEHLETLIWTAAETLFPMGFLSNNGTVEEATIDVSACKDFVEADTGDAWTATNILAKMGIVFDGTAGIPGILSKPGAGFYISYEAYSFFLQALSANNTIVSYNQDFAAPSFMGYPVYPTQGIPNDVDVMVFTYPDNLVVATNNYTADTSASLIPVYAYDGSDNVKVKLHFAVGVQTAVAGDGVVGFNFT